MRWCWRLAKPRKCLEWICSRLASTLGVHSTVLADVQGSLLHWLILLALARLWTTSTQFSTFKGHFQMS